MVGGRKAAVFALAGAMACNAGGEGTSGFTGQPGASGAATSEVGDTSGGSSTGGTSTSTSTSGANADSGSSAESSAASGVVWDMGTPPDFDVTPPGCQGKIDFLFIISRDGFMKPHQDQLVAAFPHFIETIQSEFSDFDVHILVANTQPDWHWGSAYCKDDCGDKVCEADPNYPCDYVPTTCDWKQGAGIVMNVGPYTEDKPCLEGPLRYITSETPDIAGTFECLARVGVSGYNQLGNALVAAMNPWITWPGECNEGFIRDDALLMVVIIGPEDTLGLPAGSKGTWK
ncbi:MAG TPA: hypothetical protein VIK91_22290, partial [Nannocystis sp.]